MRWFVLASVLLAVGVAQNTCTQDSECEAAAPLCVNGLCAACTSAICDSPERAPFVVCDEETAQCTTQPCADNATCSSKNAPVCTGDGVCGKCTADDDCKGHSALPFCHSASGACVQCVDDTACPEGTKCNDTACVEWQCTSDSECANGTVCNLMGGTSRFGQCVECAENKHCNDTLPRCDSFVCVACVADSNCLYTHGDHLVCDQDPKSKTHGQCVAQGAHTQPLLLVLLVVLLSVVPAHLQ